MPPMTAISVTKLSFDKPAIENNPTKNIKIIKGSKVGKI
jgi:hypothetical protein